MRVPPVTIPALVLGTLLAGYSLRTVFTRPSTQVTFSTDPGKEAAFVIEGLRCKGTAVYLGSLYDEVPGILRIETFASERKAVFTYDDLQISPQRIREIMEAPVPLEDGGLRQVFRCVSVK